MERVFTLATAATRDPAGMLEDTKYLHGGGHQLRKCQALHLGMPSRDLKNIFLLMMAEGGRKRKKRHTQVSLLFFTTTLTSLLSLLLSPSSSSLPLLLLPSPLPFPSNRTQGVKAYWVERGYLGCVVLRKQCLSLLLSLLPIVIKVHI